MKIKEIQKKFQLTKYKAEFYKYRQLISNQIQISKPKNKTINCHLEEYIQ